MGRSARRPKAPPSGAVIFYGQSTRRDRSKQELVDHSVEPPTSTSQHDTASPRSSIPSVDTSSSISHEAGSLSKLFVNESPGTSVSSSKSSELNHNSHTIRTPVLRQSIATTIALIKITVDILQNAPYVEVLAGVVQQIIQIADVSFRVCR